MSLMLSYTIRIQLKCIILKKLLQQKNNNFTNTRQSMVK